MFKSQKLKEQKKYEVGFSKEEPSLQREEVWHKISRVESSYPLCVYILWDSAKSISW